MFLILAILLVSASAYVYDMSRHNRSVVVHRLFSSTPRNPISPPLSVARYNDVTRHNHSRIPQGYRLPNSTSPPVPTRPNKTVAAEPAPAPAPVPRSLRRSTSS